MTDISNLMREPTESEMEFFRQNPMVGGMATEDNRVIINPFSSLTREEKDAVAVNEASRVFMRTSIRPKFKLTDEQRNNLRGTVYEKNEQAARETIAGRLLSGDPSGGMPTDEQKKFVDELRRRMFGQ